LSIKPGKAREEHWANDTKDKRAVLVHVLKGGKGKTTKKKGRGGDDGSDETFYRRGKEKYGQ